jgi:hypothetical protein
MTLDEVRTALRNPTPWSAFDGLVRNEQAAGRKVKEIYADLQALVEPVRALENPSEDADDAMMDTLDALAGNCRLESCYFDPPGLPLPTEKEISGLTHWSRVAFAARCARRVLPLMKYSWPGAGEPDLGTVENDVEVAERAGANAQPAARSHSDVDSVAAALGAHLEGNPAGRAVARAAFRAAQTADIDPQYDLGDSALAATDAAESAAEAAGFLGLDIRPIIRRDFDLLDRLVISHQWTDDTKVPPDVFGPLWRDGTPPGWPSTGEPAKEMVGRLGSDSTAGGRPAVGTAPTL